MVKHLAVLFFLFLIHCNTYAQNDVCLSNLELGISFPPVKDVEQRGFAKTHLDNLGVKKIRFAEEWKDREPTQGNFVWAPLDERINWANTNGYEILLTIQSNGPSWACSSVANNQSCVYTNNNYFKTYIDSLLQRYSNKISKIQFGNEWQSDFWYAGNAIDYITANNILYSSVQAYSPATMVVLGGFTTFLLRVMAGCNGNVESFKDDDGNLYDQSYLSTYCYTSEIQHAKQGIDSVLKYANYDIIDLHLYDDVEQWDEYYYHFSDTITKPIIVSEFGGPNMNYEIYSHEYQSERLEKYIKKLDSLRITEAYFFKLVEGSGNPAHEASGLISDTTLLEKPAYFLFKSFVDCKTSINNSEVQKYMRVFPNPMAEFTCIDFQDFSIQNNAQISLYRSDGKLITTITNCNNNVLLERNNLAAGFYFIEVTDNKGVVAREKLIIE